MRPRGAGGRFISYVRRPTPEVERGRGGRPRAILILVLMALALSGLSLFLVLIGGALVGLPEGTATEEEASLLAFVLMAVVWAPIVEETAFRLSLTAFRPLYLIISGAILLLVFGVAFDLVLGDALWLGLAEAAIGLTLIVVGVASAAFPRIRVRAAAFWRRHFAPIVWFSAIFFGLAHLSNFDLPDTGILTVVGAPLLVSSQMLGGLVLAFARTWLGLWAAILIHAGFNATITVLVLVAGVGA
jgi:membrane protease YdiL (CAAX protease family)